MRRPYLLFLTVVLPIRLTLQSGQSVSGRLLEYEENAIVYERYAKDGSLMKCRAKKEQVTKLRLSDPVELKELAEKSYRRGPKMKRALERGKELWELYAWGATWPGGAEAPYFAYGKLLFHCARYQEAKRYFVKSKEEAAGLYLGICYWKTKDHKKAREVLEKFAWEKGDEESAALWHYYIGRILYREEDFRNALFYLLPPPMFFALERKVDADCLFLGSVCALRAGDPGTAFRLAGILTNEYKEVEYRRHRKLILRWLEIKDRYTKTHLINTYTEELLP